MSVDNITYYRVLASLCTLLLSVFLLGEHIYRWGGIDLADIIGHETYAVILFIITLILAPKIGKSKEWEDRIIEILKKCCKHR